MIGKKPNQPNNPYEEELEPVAVASGANKSISGDLQSEGEQQLI